MYRVTLDINEVNILPSTELEEILQNVKTILATVKGTVPLDRDFGVDHKILDIPISAARAKLSAAVVTAINKFEPRVRVKKISYDDKPVGGAGLATSGDLELQVGEYRQAVKDALDGILKPYVDVEIIQDKLRGYVNIED